MKNLLDNIFSDVLDEQDFIEEVTNGETDDLLIEITESGHHYEDDKIHLFENTISDTGDTVSDEDLDAVKNELELDGEDGLLDDEDYDDIMEGEDI